MAQKKLVTDYGNVEVRNAIFDVDGTTLEEGIEIKFPNGENELIEIYGYVDVEGLNEDDVEKLIGSNLKAW